MKYREIREMLGMKYRSVAELERYFVDELTEKDALRKLVVRVEKKLRKMALLG